MFRQRPAFVDFLLVALSALTRFSLLDGRYIFSYRFHVKLGTLLARLVAFQTNLDTFPIELDTLLSKLDGFEIKLNILLIATGFFHIKIKTPETSRETFLEGKLGMTFFETFQFICQRSSEALLEILQDFNFLKKIMN